MPFFSAVLGRGEEAQEAEASLDSQTGMSKMMNHSVEFVIEKPRDQPRMIKSHLPLAVLPPKASFDTKHFFYTVPCCIAWQWALNPLNKQNYTQHAHTWRFLNC